MSLIQSTTSFQNYIERLLKQATPTTNDIRYKSYVRYINEFLKFFCAEKCFLVGSSAEKTKLTWSKDDGDADFLLVSGKLSVPVCKLEPRKDNSSFVWVRGENLDAGNSLGMSWIETEDEKTYLSAEILRDVDPKLFTFLRGVFKFFTRTTDGVPSEITKHRITVTGEGSKVGLVRTQFRNLTIKNSDRIPPLKKYIPKKLSPRSQKPTNKHLDDKNAEVLSRVFELFALFSTPGNTSEHQSQFDHFAHVIKLLLERQREERIKTKATESFVVFEQTDNLTYGREKTQEKDTGDYEDNDFERFNNEFDIPSDVKATYKEKFMIDFVPALRIEGKLRCIEEWYHRKGSWPPTDVKKDIYECECYVIAKKAPTDEDERDFCLAFNHAELMLSKACSQTQRKCFLVLKAYNKGIFEKTIEKFPTCLPLKTFHLKTALYWVIEESATSAIWEEENLIEGIVKVLQYIKNALLSKSLLHYFTLANLFLGFETIMCSALVSDIDNILREPAQSLLKFFDLENREVEITLTDDQVRSIIEMSSDGGVEKEADIIEDVMEDFKRGFKEASQNERRDVPLKEAMHHIMNIVLEDEAKRRAKKTLSEMINHGAENFGSILSRALTGLMESNGKASAPTRSLEASLTNVQKDAIYDKAEKKDQENHLSDKSGTLQNYEDSSELNKSFKEKTDLGRQLADAVSAFVFSPPRDGKESLEGEIKQKGLSYFLDELD